MSQAIREVLAFGLGVALSPAVVIAVVLMLAAPGGRVSASVFVATWALSLGAVGTVACSSPTARMLVKTPRPRIG